MYSVFYIGDLQSSLFPLCLSNSLRNNIAPILQVYMIEHDAFESFANTMNLIYIINLISTVNRSTARILAATIFSGILQMTK